MEFLSCYDPKSICNIKWNATFCLADLKCSSSEFIIHKIVYNFLAVNKDCNLTAGHHL